MATAAEKTLGSVLQLSNLCLVSTVSFLVLVAQEAAAADILQLVNFVEALAGWSFTIARRWEWSHTISETVLCHIRSTCAQYWETIRKPLPGIFQRPNRCIP
jgi:hypothetical protein